MKSIYGSFKKFAYHIKDFKEVLKVALAFSRVKKYTRLLDPRSNFQEARLESEIRFHPLTKKTGRVAHFAGAKFTKPDFQEVVESTQKVCPFCPDKVEKITPLFPPDLVPTGRIRFKEAIVIPNLNPYDAHSAVTVMTKAHYLPLPLFTPEQLLNAFTASLNYFEQVAKGDPEAAYCLINWNCMPPAASSQLHPHLQVFATSTPGNTHAEELSASQTYQKENGRNFWAEFVTEEKKLGERYIAEINDTVWLTSFVPFGVLGDILIIFKERPSMWEISQKDLEALATGLCRVFKYYDDCGIYSFNLAFYPGPQNQDYFWTHACISARTILQPTLGTTDLGTLRQLYNEPYTLVWPEELSKKLKAYFT